MKALKIILYAIVAIALLYLALAFAGPKNYHVERSKLISAPEDVVWSQVAYFKNWPTWSPWQEKDPGVKNTYEGEDGSLGAIMKWVGDEKKTGTGQMVITSIEKNKKLNYDLSFVVPFESYSKGYFQLDPSENNTTKLTWVDEGDIEFMFRPMMMFMDMDAMIGSDFERGLVKIDSLSGIMHKLSEQKMQDVSDMSSDTTATNVTEVK